MSRRGAVLAANAATAQRGLAGNSQGAAMAPGSAPSGLLQTLGINSSSGQTLQHTGGWGDAYGGGSLPRPPATFTDGAYGPFSPIIPAALDEGEPPYGLPPARREQYRVGWNLPTGEPGAEGLKLCSFETLRSLADLYSVARACIQYLKTEITSLEWDIMPTRDAAKTMKGSKSQALDFGKRRAEAVGFFRRPDPDYFSWQTWLSAVLEEMLVYDALSLVIRQKWGKGMGKGLLGGDLDSLQLISGSTVRPLYDIHGATPRPPAPAYQQYLYGVPRVDLMTVIMERDIEEAEMRGSELGSYHGDQLLYLPVTPRRWTPYGFSPIERGLIPIISGLNKQAYALDFFTQGTVPAVYVSPGQDMSPTQIRELQTALNGITGDPAQHHRIIVLPSGSRTDPQRPTALADQFDEIIMSQVCMAFGVMPMQIGISPKVSTTQSPGAANQMAKASANNQDQGTLQPTLIFLATIMERVLAVMCGQTDMRFMFDGMQEEEDEETTTNLVVNQTTHALTTIDEGREQLGKEPYGIPESSEPGFLVATGWMPLAGSAAAAEAQREQAAAPPPAPIIGDPNLTRQALTAPNGQPPKSLTQKKPAAQQASGSKKTPAQTANAQAAQANTTSQASAQGAQQERSANPAAATKVADMVQPDVVPDADTAQPPPQQAVSVRNALIADVGAALAKQLMGIMLDLYAGKVSLLQAVASAVTAMDGGYRHVLGHASNAASRTLESTPPLPDHVLDDLAATLGEQQRQYVTGMAQATVNASTQAADLTWLPARTRMYGSTLNGAWNNGFGDTIEDAHPDSKIVWRLGETEHCDLCLARDGQEFTFDTLPGFPGDGGFGGDLCEGGPLCGCALVYKEGDKVLHQVENAQRPEAIAYYAQQRQDIVAARAQLAADQAAFAASLPAKVGQDGTSARSRAMNRDDLRNELARLANQRIRQAGGYSGVSVEPQDIPAEIIASLLPQYGPQPDVSDLPITALMDAVESMFVGRYSTMDITKSAFTALMLTSVVDLMRTADKTASDDDRRAVQAEMEACARHLIKGRAVTNWRREHLTIADVATLADLVHTGALTRAECVKTAMDRRHVLIDGTIVEPEIPQASLVQGSAAGGGGYVLLAHDEYGIQHDDDMSSPHPRPNATKVGPKGYIHGWIHVGDAVDSLGMHTDSGGNVTAKRAALHDKLINATLAGHESEEHPVATFLGGGPASGKTSVMRDTKGMVIAADDLKFQLPEYKKMLKNRDKRAAAFTHEESSHMTGNLVKEASKRKVSFILDGLGDSGIDKLTKKVEGIRATGHRVDAKYVTVDTEEAVRRAKARAQKTGFLVPETSMRASHAAVSRTFKAAIDRNLFDRAELWDNNGREPKLIGRKLPDGPWQVHDQEAWQKFLAKGQEA